MAKMTYALALKANCTRVWLKQIQTYIHIERERHSLSYGNGSHRVYAPFASLQSAHTASKCRDSNLTKQN